VIWVCLAVLPVSFVGSLLLWAPNPSPVRYEPLLRLNERNGSFSAEIDPEIRIRERLERHRLRY
jgi:hypothetical protein